MYGYSKFIPRRTSLAAVVVYDTRPALEGKLSECIYVVCCCKNIIFPIYVLCSTHIVMTEI